MRNLDCGFAPTRGLVVIAEREVCHRQREVRGSDEIVSRTEPQRELGVRLRLPGLAHGCLGKGQCNNGTGKVWIDFVGTPQISKAALVFTASDADHATSHQCSLIL